MLFYYQTIFYFILFYFIYFILFYFILFLAVLGLPCCTAFSPAVADGGYSLVAACRFLVAVASPLAEHGL